MKWMSSTERKKKNDERSGTKSNRLSLFVFFIELGCKSGRRKIPDEWESRLQPIPSYKTSPNSTGPRHFINIADSSCSHSIFFTTEKCSLSSPVITSEWTGNCENFFLTTSNYPILVFVKLNIFEFSKLIHFADWEMYKIIIFDQCSNRVKNDKNM